VSVDACVWDDATMRAVPAVGYPACSSASSAGILIPYFALCELEPQLLDWLDRRFPY
jgi:hypothetical protein